MEEARRQVMESGYGTMTIRSVAKGCNVGIGTVYNYYASKEALVAAFMLVDWKDCIHQITCRADTAPEPVAVLEAIYRNLSQFYLRYSPIFLDSSAASGSSGSFRQYHVLLRSQLAAPIRRFCPDSFTAEFIAEAMLVWTVDGKPFEEICQVVKKLFT